MARGFGVPVAEAEAEAEDGDGTGRFLFFSCSFGALMLDSPADEDDAEDSERTGEGERLRL